MVEAKDRMSVIVNPLDVIVHSPDFGGDRINNKPSFDVSISVDTCISIEELKKWDKPLARLVVVFSDKASSSPMFFTNTVSAIRTAIENVDIDEIIFVNELEDNSFFLKNMFASYIKNSKFYEDWQILHDGFCYARFLYGTTHLE